jgi:hypothetical protein
LRQRIKFIAALMSPVVSCKGMFQAFFVVCLCSKHMVHAYAYSPPAKNIRPITANFFLWPDTADAISRLRDGSSKTRFLIFPAMPTIHKQEQPSIMINVNQCFSLLVFPEIEKGYGQQYQDQHACYQTSIPIPTKGNTPWLLKPAETTEIRLVFKSNTCWLLLAVNIWFCCVPLKKYRTVAMHTASANKVPGTVTARHHFLFDRDLWSFIQ